MYEANAQKLDYSWSDVVCMNVVVKIVLMIDSSFVAKCNTKWSTCSASPGGYTKDIYCCSGLLYNSLTSVNVVLQLLPAVCGCLPQQPVIPASCSPWTLKGVSFPTHFFSFGTIDLQFRNSDFCYQLSLEYIYTGPFDHSRLYLSLYAWTVISKRSWGPTHLGLLDVKLRCQEESSWVELSWAELSWV